MGVFADTASAINYDRSFGSPGTSTISMPTGSHQTRVTGFNLPRITSYSAKWWYRTQGGSWQHVKDSDIGAWGTYVMLDIDWNGTRFLVDGSRQVNSSYIEVVADVFRSGNWDESHYWNITGQVQDYTVTLNRQGGSGGSSSVIARLGSPMPAASAPSRTGYDFLGYWDQISGGTIYYNANMSSARNWDKTHNATLYARWQARSYNVALDRQGGSGGSSSVTATYDSAMPSASAPSRTGYIFEGYFDQTSGGTRYYNANMSSARAWDKAHNATLYARWTPRQYSVTFDRQGGSGGSSSVTATYDSHMPSASAPSRTGHTFGGYFDQTNGNGTRYYNANMSSARTWNKTQNATLYAYWTPILYTVTLDRQGGSGGSDSVSATFGSPMPSATAPSRSGHTFQGYFDQTLGRGTRYYNSNMSSAQNWDKTSGGTLYANWVPDHGNLTAQEYGDAVYRFFDMVDIAGLRYNYNHAGVYRGMNAAGEHRVFESSGKGSNHDTTQDNSFSSSFTAHADPYYGAYSVSDRTLAAQDRRNIVATGKELVDAFILYPTEYNTIPKAIVYTGSAPVPVSRILALRCDGLVEYAYERNDVRVWRNNDSSSWSIYSDPEPHNDQPDNTRNPERELSPWAQRGAPPSTGPIVFGSPYSGPLWPDTRMTQPSVVSGPSITALVASSQPGGVLITIRGVDVSGVFRIRAQNVTSQNPLTFPNSNIWETERTYTQPGTYTLEAWDYAGNKGSATMTLASQTLTVRSTPPKGVTISSTSGHGGSTDYTRSSIVQYSQVNLQAPGSDPSGYTFVRWTLDGVNQSAGQKSITFEMTGNRTAEAVYEPRTYDVTYHANSATSGSAPAPQSKIHGQNLTLRTNSGNLARTGYTFAGWNTQANGSGTDYAAGGTYTANAAVTLYAKWSANSYTVNFNAEGGTVSPTSKTVTFYSTYGSLPTPTRAGFSFAGWWTGAGGTGTEITSASTVATASNHALYAKWTTVPITVTFDPQGGSVSPTTKVVSQGGTYGTLPTPMRSGFTFEGWWTGAGGTGAEITSASTVSTASNHTLYAKWTATPVTVSFDAQGGSVSPTSKTVTPGSSYGALPTPNREGNTFGGWWTGTGGTGSQIVSSTIVSLTVNHTLYAKWIDDSDTTPPTVTITSPTSAATWTSPNATMNIGGTAADNVGVTSVKVRNFRDVGEYTCTGTTSWQYNNLPLFQGQNRITVTAYDAAGNSATDTITVTYNGDTRYDDVLRSGGVMQEIEFPDNLTPGSTVTVRWKVLSYVPVVSRVYAGVPGAGGWSFFKNGTYTGFEQSPWNLDGRHAGVYAFECEFPVPEKSGEFKVWFNVAQMDAYQFMIPVIPDGVDPRPDPQYAKLLERTILPGGTGENPVSDTDIYDSAMRFENVNQCKMRSSATVVDLSMPDNLTPGAQVTVEWKVHSYVPVNGQLLLLNLDQQQVWLSANGTRIGNPVKTTFSFQDRATGTRHYADEYTFRATFTVPDQPGTQQVFFRCQTSGSPWMAATIAAGIDARPAEYNGMFGRFIERAINP